MKAARLFALTLFLVAPAISMMAAQGTAPADADPPARPDLVTEPYSAADVEFMQGMIPHHAQAVLIGKWAGTHGARPDVLVLCQRIVVSQTDEIKFMRMWLRDRGEDVPASGAKAHRMVMNGMAHDMLMPGMLSEAQLAELDKARGPAWDRLFLTLMIAHHRGALKMADDLFKTRGAMQGNDVFRFVSDIHADQTTEIDRMTLMLDGPVK